MTETQQFRRLLAACSKGDASAAFRALGSRGCLSSAHTDDSDQEVSVGHEDSGEHWDRSGVPPARPAPGLRRTLPQASRYSRVQFVPIVYANTLPIQAALLLASSAGDGSTVLHALCTGEPLGPLGGCLLWALRAHQGGTWPSRHQRARQELLALLLQRNPGLLLKAGSRDAEGATPLHRAVLSQSLGPLALLLAALQQLPHPAGAAGTTSALHLLLSVPNAEGLSAFELAVSRQQWAAARLLAAAARGASSLSQAQLEASELVRRCMAAAGSGGRSGRSASSAGTAGAAGGLQLSASGPTVTDALGGLLSKLWDAFGSSASAAELERGRENGGKKPALPLDHARPSRTDSRADGHALLQGVLHPEALDLAAVLELLRQEEQGRLGAAIAAAAHAAKESTAAASAARTSSSSSQEALPGGTATMHAGAPPAPVAAAHSSAAGLRACIVCYDELPPGWLSVQLCCGHATCDACWRGILLAAIDEGELPCCWSNHGCSLPLLCVPATEHQHCTLTLAWCAAASHTARCHLGAGDPRRAACPQPGCSVPLPLDAAQRLIPAASLRRFQRLQVQRYVAERPGGMRCCPRPGCGATLHIPDAVAAALAAPLQGADAGAAGAAAQGAATAEPSSSAAARAAEEEEAGLDAECSACGGAFCWRCGEEPHEPASCSQVAGARFLGLVAGLRRGPCAPSVLNGRPPP